MKEEEFEPPRKNEWLTTRKMGKSRARLRHNKLRNEMGGTIGEEVGCEAEAEAQQAEKWDGNKVVIRI